MSEALRNIAKDILERRGHDTEFKKLTGHYCTTEPTFCWLKCKKCARVFESSVNGIWLIKPMLNGFAYESVYDEDSKSCEEMIIQDIIK